VLGGDVFASVLGAAPAGDPERLTNIVRAMVRNNLSPVLLKPGTKLPACILTESAAHKADQEARAKFLAEYPDRRADSIRHPCGFAHVIDDPVKVKATMDRWLTRYGGANLGVHLGRSRLIAVDADYPSEVTAFEHEWFQHNHPGLAGRGGPGMTVRSPGTTKPDGTPDHHGGGHWIFIVPDDFPFPPGKGYRAEKGYDVKYGDSYVLVPPSVRAEGPYELIGASYPAPDWLLDMITNHGEAAAQSERKPWDGVGGDIEAANSRTSWESILAPAGWTVGGRAGCGCARWRHPEASSAHSAIAHERCAEFSDDGLLVMFSSSSSTLSDGAHPKPRVIAALHTGGDIRAALAGMGVPLRTEIGGGQVLELNRPDAMPPADRRRALVLAKAEELRIRAEAQALVRAENRPAEPEMLSLATLLAQPPEQPSYRIDGLWRTGSVALMSAPQKAGKTTTIGNLVRSLVDGDPFLNHFQVQRPCSRVVLIDTESGRQLLYEWLGPQRIRNQDALDVIDLRGKESALDVTDAATRTWWLAKLAGADVVILDVAGPVVAALGLDENSNADVGRFFTSFRALLADAGVGEGLIVHHTGHNEQRAVGASAWLRYADSIWQLHRENELPTSPRYFSAYGRMPVVDQGLVTFDPITRRLTYTGKPMGAAKTDREVLALLEWLQSEGEPRTATACAGYLKSEGISSRDRARQIAPAGVRQGLLTLTRDGSAQLYSPLNLGVFIPPASPLDCCVRGCADVSAHTRGGCVRGYIAARAHIVIKTMIIKPRNQEGSMNDRQRLADEINTWSARTGQHLGSVRAAVAAGDYALARQRFERVRRIVPAEPSDLDADQLCALLDHHDVDRGLSVIKVQLWLGERGLWSSDAVVMNARRRRRKQQ
jgi:hypothetical protein